MKSAKYLLDTSALGCHLFRGRGADIVAECLQTGAEACVLSLFEFAMVLRKHQVPEPAATRFWSVYREQLTRLCAVDEAIIQAALTIRRSASGRLPLADACIAACARERGLCLVHADKHFQAITVPIEMIDITDGKPSQHP